MLAELSVKNLALIDELAISFGPGGNVMTGETGAGKSIVVGALGLLLGRRASADMVRAGAEEAEVAAVFELDRPADFATVLEQLGLALEDQFILRRVVTAAGRSRCYVNGCPVPQNQFGLLGEELLSISGQHDQQSLLRPASQMKYLDDFGRHQKLLSDMRQAHQALGRAAEELAALEGRLKEAEEKRDLYEFQRDEIKKINPRANEDDELLAEKNQAKNSGRLLEALASASEILGGEPGNVVEKLGRVRRALETAAGFDSAFDPARAMVDDSYHQLADLAVELEKTGRDLDIDPDRLDWVEERLNTLAKLKRKYGLSLADIVGRGRELTELLNELDGAGLDLARLRRERDEALAGAVQAARVLSAARAETAARLTTVLIKHLKPLGFPKIDMRVSVDSPDQAAPADELFSRLGPDGFDRVEFLFCPNPGEGLKPLARIASGGELSRFMLALKTAPERSGDQLMVFDEIDTGLGGVTAEAVAAKMAELSTRQQIIVITHLPQMAALAGRHFVVSKDAAPKSGRTVTSIKLLPEEKRADELARMLGGSAPSPEALALAGQLLAGQGRGVKAAASR